MANKPTEITVVSSGTFRANPAHYLANVVEKPIAIVAASGDARITVMGPADLDAPDPFDDDDGEPNEGAESLPSK